MKIKKYTGFTFLEVILYIALATIVVGVVFSYGWNIVSIKVKETTVRETMSSARLVSERVKAEIRAAKEIDQVQSDFSNGKMVLKNEAGDEVKIESINDKITIKRGGSSADFLHSDNVQIKNFKFSNQVTSDGVSQYVGFSFDAEAYYPQAGNRYEYNFSLPYQAGAEIRSH